MKRPYDLVAFMKQEERAGMLDQLKQELLARKDEIDKTEDRDTGEHPPHSPLVLGSWCVSFPWGATYHMCQGFLKLY